MNILALDQSTRKVGYSIYENGELTQFGNYEPEFKATTDKRILQIYQWLKRAIDTIKNVDLILLEDVQLQTRINGSKKYFNNYGNNVLTFKILSQLQGVLINLCNELNIKYEIISPSHWKSIIGIKSIMRDAQKVEAMDFVENNFGQYAEEDEADAICIGFSYIKENNIK